MSKSLIIAEKPSVAADIARALGGVTRKGDYFEVDEYLISSAVGHLLQLSLPESHDVKKGKWSFANLPVIPPLCDLAPIVGYGIGIVVGPAIGLIAGWCVFRRLGQRRTVANDAA